jgi:Permuted papain-like amidase enzyme, YaeF/YiiX, C92 family
MRHHRPKRGIWKLLLHLLDVQIEVNPDNYIPEAMRSEIRSLLQPGDVLMESHNAYPYSQIVAKLLFGTNWIHAALYIGDEKVVHSGRKPHVTLDPLEEFLHTTDVAIYRPNYVKNEDRDAAISYAEKAVGKPFNITLDDTHGHSFYCTQLISEALLSMPDPINLAHRRVLWKSIIPPVAVETSKDFKFIWSSHPDFVRNIGTHIPGIALSKRGENKSG